MTRLALLLAFLAGAAAMLVVMIYSVEYPIHVSLRCKKGAR